METKYLLSQLNDPAISLAFKIPSSSISLFSYIRKSVRILTIISIKFKDKYLNSTFSSNFSPSFRFDPIPGPI